MEQRRHGRQAEQADGGDEPPALAARPLPAAVPRAVIDDDVRSTSAARCVMAVARNSALVGGDAMVVVAAQRSYSASRVPLSR